MLWLLSIGIIQWTYTNTWIDDIELKLEIIVIFIFYKRESAFLCFGTVASTLYE